MKANRPAGAVVVARTVEAVFVAFAVKADPKFVV
jgi:hypothetical protein